MSLADYADKTQNNTNYNMSFLCEIMQLAAFICEICVIYERQCRLR